MQQTQQRISYRVPAVSATRLWLIPAVLVLIYFINCFTSFRLTNDTVRYFAQLERLRGSWPEAFGYKSDFLPLGYVYFLQALSYVKVIGPFAIAFIQLLYLLGSLHFVSRIFAPHVRAFAITVFVLLNWTAIKFTLTPLSEMQFLFFSSGALYFFHRFHTQKGTGHLFLTALFCVLAIFTRTAGVVLALSLLLALFIYNRATIARHAGKRIVLVIGVVAAVAGLVFLFTHPKFIAYLGYFTRPLTSDPLHFFTRNIEWHLTDWAELFVNIPLSKMPYANYARVVYILAGIFFIVLIGLRLLSKRFSIPLHIRIYCLAYFVMILNWPFFEARFWFPVFPLVGAVLFMPRNDKHLYRGLLARGMEWYYVLAGLFVLGYYTWISFDKTAMAKRHDAGKWKDEYRLHFFNEPPPDSSYNRKAFYLLEKYD